VARIAFTSLGSLGDLYPMMPIADRLRASGHDLIFVVPDNLAGAVLAEGFRCSPVRIPSFPATSHETTPGAVRSRIRARFPTLLEGALVALEVACRGADLLVTHPLQLAAAITAKRLGLRWVTLTVFPGFIPSAYTVPQPHWLPALPGPAGRAVNRATWRIFDYGVRHLSGDVVDEVLQAQGVTRDDEVFTPGGLSPYLALVLSSPEYTPRLPDWPAHVKVAGYTAWDAPRSWTEPPDLAGFIDGGEPPVLVTTSTAGERDANLFFEIAAGALSAAGRRGILLTGDRARGMAAEPGSRISSTVAAWPYVPLSRVMPKCSMVVHHAGIGTVLTTLRHGKACVAIPATFDQWYNAGRVKALGIGRVLEWKRLTARRLADAIAQVSGGGAFARRAQSIGSRIATEDGAAVSCREIEALLPSR